MADKRFVKGLFKDTGHIDQPEGTWRHARNMVINSTDGAVSNEGGNMLAGRLGSDPTTGAQKDQVIGTIECSDNRTVMFITDVVDPSGEARSEIGIYEDDIYTPLFNPSIEPPSGKHTNDLNFRQSHPIEGTFKIDSKGDLIVYWTDDLNPPRTFNVDRQKRESTSGGLLLIQNLYGISPINLDNIDILNLFPYSGPVPHIYLGDIYWGTPPFQEAVNEGGGLLTGVYYLALAYVDDDFVATNYLTVSNPISIVEEYDHTRPTTKKDGAKEGSQTSKSITWRVNNLNTNYKYMRPAIIRKMGQATEVFKLEDIEINLNLAPTPFQEVTYSGLETKATGSVEEVIIDTIAYDSVKTIQQLDSVLYLGNTTRDVDLGFQKYANNIKARSFVKTINDFDPIWATVDGLQTGFGQSKVDEGNYVEDNKSYRYIPNITNFKGYMRDEVYAFYIAFIMNDGSMSYAYHIPGRDYIRSDYSGYDLVGNHDEIDSVPGTSAASRALRDLSDDSKLYHFYDRSWVNTGANSHSSGSRHMQFWRNSTELYPSTDNFEIWNGASGYTGNDLKGERVRHHKMPSNHNGSRTTVTSDFETDIIPSTVDPTPVLPNLYVGSFKAKLHNGSYNYANPSCLPTAQGNQFLPGGSYATVDMDQVFDDNPTNGVSATSTVYNGNTFTAQAACTVTCEMYVMFFNDHNSTPHTARGRFRVQGGSVGPTSSLYVKPARSGVCLTPLPLLYGATYAIQMGAGILPGPPTPDSNMTGTWTVNLNAGDKINFTAKGYESSSGSKKITPLCHNKTQSVGLSGLLGTFTTDSWVKYTVQYGQNEDYHDAHVKHNVNILGMHFDDIKIPASYKDKIQGFRIFRANRKHSNKTILGQSHIIPIVDEFGVLGLCKEALDPSEAAFSSQVMSSAGLEAETFKAMTAWALNGGSYIPSTGASSQHSTYAYTNIQFYDFGLLRNKYSLAPATHIQMQYKTHDLVWNGPEINQPKKMITVLSPGTGNPPGPYQVREVWGYDNHGPSDNVGKFQNCYEREVDSALFVGGHYQRGYTAWSSNDWNVNRVLGQKSKSYIKGDSIFKAGSLGFGGKLVKTGGNSSIVLGIKDRLELPALWSQQHKTNPNEWWGNYNPGFGFNLVTRSESDVMGTGTGVNLQPRHQNYTINLNAFKTDVYKSIDTQELVWTGWEVLGDDLNNFLFDDSTAIGQLYVPPTQGTYSTEDIIPSGSEISGVFGGDTYIARYGVAEAYSPLDDQTLATPQSSIHSYIVESSDNIAFRHAESDDSLYYPGSIAKDVLTVSGRDTDLNHIDNLKYNDNYSSVNDIRTAFPLPLKDVLQNDFPTRTHRSAKNDTTSIIDNYRIFLANQFKDLPKNRGELWKLASFNNLLYFHMQESLFASQGKQTMEMKDGSEAFIGSGDIFVQEPNELVQTEGGFGGTQSQRGVITTRYGYFFVDQAAGKVFMMKDSLEEISKLGMKTWFKENLPFVLSPYGITDDNPLARFGIHCTYDPEFKRILLTKREVIPTQAFLNNLKLFYIPFGTVGSFLSIRYNPNTNRYQQAGLFGGWGDISWNDASKFSQEKTGWTISYYPEMGFWGSFHDYIPYHYFKNSNAFYSLTDQYPRPVVFATDGTTFGNAGIWKHNHHGRNTLHPGDGYGVLYQENAAFTYTTDAWLELVNHHPFEFEFIHNEYKIDDTLVSSFSYTLETFNQENISVLEHGFTQYLLYNTFQMSGLEDLEYLINTRRIGNSWKINKFRDMAAEVTNVSPYYMSTGTNVIGGINTGTITTNPGQNMFIYDGMSKTINNAYLNLAKSWDLQKKFIDKWVGIRLIYNNISNNSLNLYATDVVVRKMHR